MADSIMDKITATIAGLRARTKSNPDNPKLHPIEQRREGYRLYCQEQQQMGEVCQPYSEWIKSQE